MKKRGNTQKRLLLIFAIILFSTLLFAQKQVHKIAFGSCSSQDRPLPIFDLVVKHDPDLFIFLGDNIYGDTQNMDTLKAKYARLASKSSFENLNSHVEIIATWDDHDFGWNDIGRHYPFKKESKEIFLQFFNEAQNSERWNHEGIYTSYNYKSCKKTVQIILLDNRNFRDNLKPYQGEFSKDKRYFYELDYAPYQHSDSTFLGDIQWNWLEAELMKPADIRIIGSGSQFGIEYNGYESWANFPNEQKKFLNLIKKTRAEGLFFISGDVHYAEISKLTEKDLYPIYDVTSSGLSSTWHFATPNKNRIEGPVMENHFAMITIGKKNKNPKIKFEIWDILDNQRVEYTIKLQEIKFK